MPLVSLRLSRDSKVKTAQALWNTTDAARVALAYTPDSTWRNRGTFVKGRGEIQTFLEDKWRREKNYTLRKEVSHHAVRGGRNSAFDANEPFP